jgi:hypothetical protein
MNFINVPNLPQNRIKLAVVDGRINNKLKDKFYETGINLILTKIHPNLYSSISYHPDVILHHIYEKNIIYAPGTDTDTLNELNSLGFKLIKGEAELSYKYPGNIAYNVARVGNFAFHNLKYSDTVLKNELSKLGVELIHVSQGYSKCSISIVDANSIITADLGIAKAAEKKHIDVLLIEAGENIVLTGLATGFIGGSTGLFNKTEWAISGNIELLTSYKKIYDFLNLRNIKIISLTDEPIIDIGSIIPLLTE